MAVDQTIVQTTMQTSEDYCSQLDRDSNLKLNRKKLQLGLEEVTYIGRLLTNKGLRPDLMKVQAIQALPQAMNESQ